MPWEVSTTLDREVGSWKTLRLSGIRTLPYATQTGEPSVGSEKIFSTSWPPISACLIAQIAMSLIICLIVIQQEINKTPCNVEDELKAKVTAILCNLNKEATEKAWKRFEVVCRLRLKTVLNFLNKLHHHHHIALVARISLTLSRHSSLSFIALGRSSGQHPVSSHSCWMYVRAGRPAFARPCVGVHKSTSLMSSSLLLQQCPACLVRLTWIVFVIGGRWPYS